jgi:hypothetical protein
MMRTANPYGLQPFSDRIHDDIAISKARNKRWIVEVERLLHNEFT